MYEIHLFECNVLLLVSDWIALSWLNPFILKWMENHKIVHNLIREVFEKFSDFS